MFKSFLIFKTRFCFTSKIINMYAFKIVTVNYANDPHIEILFPSQLPPLC